MVNAIYIEPINPGEHDVWACGKCGFEYDTEEEAEQCCAEKQDDTKPAEEVDEAASREGR